MERVIPVIGRGLPRRRVSRPTLRGRELIVPGVVAVVQLVATFGASRHHHPPLSVNAGDVALLLVGPLALAVRRRHPVAVMWITFLATLGPDVARFAYLSLIVAFLSAATSGHRRGAWVMLVAGYVASLWLTPLVFGDPTTSLADALLLGGWLAVLAIAAETVRIRRERGVAAAAARDAIDRERTSAQRLEIARELHDVVGHNISLINLQAGVGLDLLEARPEQAREALGAIRTVSGEALQELRAMLASLREDDDAPPRAPSPDLQRLPELVELARGAGLAVSCETSGTPRRLPTAVELAAYRIVQESLTNVVRHAPGATARVRLRYEPGGLDVVVTDSGAASRPGPARKAPPPPGGERPAERPGSGIAGMRERASALGGRLDARRANGGFEVCAHLPVDGPP